MQLEAAAGSWADLPAELLEIIYGGLANCREIIGFRSVCRRWRFSTPPPPNKISGMFPLRPSFLDKPNPSGRYDFVINASAVYLVRPRVAAAADACSKAWMVALHEASAGKLVLRHPLTYKVIYNSALDVDQIAATQTPIARSYGHNQLCMRCNQVSGARKVGFVRECSQLVGLCEYGPRVDMFAFRMELSDDGTRTITRASQLHLDFHLDAIGTFNGRVFAIDYDGRIYLLNNASLELIHLNSVPRPDNTFPNFLVSDGDLYLVSVTATYENRPPTCQIYRLQVVADPQICLLVEKVYDLGDDRVFFAGITCAFAVSASRDLPPPWKGNCVVFGGVPISSCVCNKMCDFLPTTVVFVLGGGQNPQCIPITSFQGYSELFSPPAAAAAAAN